MTDRPILFSGPMIRAIRDGRKTQTRRVLKPQPVIQPLCSEELEDVEIRGWEAIPSDGDFAVIEKKPYAIGDRLWVREAWNAFSFSQDGDDAWPTPTIPTLEEMNFDPCRYGPPQIVYQESERARKWFRDQTWRPSIHMPRWASRLTLIVTDVRVQRLHDISSEDVEAEGMLVGETEFGEIVYSGICQDYPIPPEHCHHWPEEAFAELWDSLNAARGVGWHMNPWVVATTFTAHECNIDQMESAA